MIAVTGASGKLGRIVVEGLMEVHPVKDVAAVVRTPDKVADLAEKGVMVRRGDYSEPSTLEAAFEGVDRVLLISSNEFGRRLEQHQAVITAAKKQGVSLLAYTSVLKAPENRISALADHKGTEAALKASGIPHVLLRNGWYIENYTDNLQIPLSTGALLGASGEGRIAAASRADFAAAAIAVLTGAGHAGKVYELAGDTSFTKAELAAKVSAWAGKPIAYQNMTGEEYQQILEGAGLPAPFAAFMTDADLAIARGELDSDRKDLRELIGRPTQSIEQVLEGMDRNLLVQT